MATEPDLRTLLLEARDLTAQQAKALEKELKNDTENLALRTKLLAYYFSQEPRTREAADGHERHVLWFIEHHPDAEIVGYPYVSIDQESQPGAYAKARELWLRHVRANDKNPVILGNAARFFRHSDHEKAIELLKKVVELEPDNPKWLDRLGQQYKRGILRHGEPDTEAAQRSLETYEKALEKASAEERYYWLSDVAQVAVFAGKCDDAKTYARELLDTAEKRPRDWNYGNAVHHGNLVLGRIALIENNLDAAERYLLKAGETPGSPQLDSFGPNMFLAKQLLEKGRKDAVIKYLKLCGEFWKSGRAQLDTWTKVIKRGAIPDFGANLRY